MPALLALLSAVWVAPLRAELVVFADGQFLHVEGYRVEGERAILDLPAGGVLRVALGRVDRVLDDRPARAPAEPPPVAAFSLRFDPAQALPQVPYGEQIRQAAERHGLNPQLVAAVARAESAFRADAVSVKGARGLMQLMPATAERFGVALAEIHDPTRNLDAGARYLRLLADRYADDLSLVLAAYNAGEGTVARYGGVPPYRETRGYLARIFGELGLDRTGTTAPASTVVASR